MTTAKYWNFLTLACLATVTIYSAPTMACMCEYNDIANIYCNLDYAVLARVTGIHNDGALTKFDLDIKTSYKLTPEGDKALKNGLFTSHAVNCNVDLELGKTYVIAGNHSQMNICNTYVQEYYKLTIKEKNGFEGEYGRNCNENNIFSVPL